jgi:hypothetical protein
VIDRTSLPWHDQPVADLRETVNAALETEGLSLRDARRARTLVLEACPDYPAERIRTLHLWNRRYGLSWQLDNHRTGFTKVGFGIEDLVAYVVNDIQSPSKRWCPWCHQEYFAAGLSEGACSDCADELREDRSEPYQRLRVSGFSANSPD